VREVGHVALAGRDAAGDQQGGIVVEAGGQPDDVLGRATDVQAIDDADDASQPLLLPSPLAI
jgi:hypothetical protein